MSKGGHCVFTGRPTTLRSYLLENDIDCPQDVLPIELLLKISSKFPKQRVKSLINQIHINGSSDEQIVEVNIIVHSIYYNSLFTSDAITRVNKDWQ